MTLLSALQNAVEQYPAVQAAIEELRASTANIAVARANYLPHLDGVWQTTRATANNVFGQMLPQSTIPSLTGPVLAVSVPSVWDSAIGALMSWEPVDFGLRSATVHEAEAAVVRAKAEQALTQLTVQQAVGDAFLNVAIAQQAMTAADADVERRTTLSRTVHTLIDNQLRAGAEGSRADAELAASRTRAIQARQSWLVARAILGRMMGAAGDIDADAAALLGAMLPNSPSPGAKVEHPLVTAAAASVELARRREDVLARTNRPRVYLESSLFARGSGANADGTVGGGAAGLGFDRANWAAGIQVVVPNAFEFSSLRARRAAAQALTRAEIATQHERVLSVTAERRIADAAVEAARAIANNTPLQLDAARQGESQARARYEAGLAGITDVADAQGLLAAAEFQDASARIGVWRALLAQAVAGGDIEPFIAQLRAAGVQ